MREDRDRLGSSLIFIAGAICGAGVASFFDRQRGADRREWLRNAVGCGLDDARSIATEYWATINDSTLPDSELEELVRERLQAECDFNAVELEVRDGHVTVWGGLSYQDAARISDLLRGIPDVSSYYVQPDDQRNIREISDERGISGRERAVGAHSFAA